MRLAFVTFALLSMLVGTAHAEYQVVARTGTNPGELLEPRDIAIDPSGNVLVVESRDGASGPHGRVSRFSATGEFLGSFGSRGPGTGQFLNAPISIAVDPTSSAILVSEEISGRVTVFSSTGSYVRDWVVANAAYPNKIAVNGAGEVVAATTNGVQVFNQLGVYLRSLGFQETHVTDIVPVAGEYTYVMDLQTGFTGVQTNGGVYQSTYSIFGGIRAPAVAIDGDDLMFYGAAEPKDNLPEGTMRRLSMTTGSLKGSVPASETGPPSEFATRGTRTYVLSSGELRLFDRARVETSVRFEGATALTGQALVVIAQATVPFSRVASYEWDLDDDGVFERRTIDRYVDVIYATPGVRRVHLRAVSVDGHTGTATTSIEIAARPVVITPGPPVPPAGPVGIVIQSGARYTNVANVDLALRWPLGADAAYISNSPGFVGAARVPVSPHISWQLARPASATAPAIVYVRYIGVGDPDRTHQDDIVLDQAPPKVLALTAKLAPTAKPQPKYAIQFALKAQDATSGVARMQFTRTTAKPGKWTPFRTTVKVRNTTGTYFVRVDDRAGNVSAWRKVVVKAPEVRKPKPRR